MSPTVNRETFVVEPGPWHRLLVMPLAVLAAGGLLVGAIAMFFIDPGHWLARLALWSLALVFAGLSAVMLLLGLSLFSRVEVGPDRLKVRVPQWRGPLAWFPWVRAEIPYRDIKAVERRDEFFKSFGLPSVQTAYSIANAQGGRIMLGHTSPMAAINLPYEEAARLIAERAGVSFVDRGGVKMGGVVRNALDGPASWDTPSISEAERQATHAKAMRAFSLVFALFAALIALRACLQIN